MKKILIMCYSPLHRDPRVLRQIDALLGHVQIITAGYTHPNRPVNMHINLIPPKHENVIVHRIKLVLSILGFVQYAHWTSEKRKDFKNLKNEDVDWIISNDLETLPISLKLAKRNYSQLIFDAHEYFPGYLQSNSLRNRIYKHLIIASCKNFLPQADFMTVVSPEIQKLYRQNFNCDSVLVTNATAYKKLKPGKVDSNKIHLVHHGIAAPARKIELMIEMMKYLRIEFVLHLYLVESPNFEDYYLDLKSAASQYGSKIVFHNIVPTDRIPEEINQYDVGVFLLPPNNINYKYALPNKFFEFIQARLAIAIGPSVDMKKYVEKYELGVISDDFSTKSFSLMLNNLTIEDVNKYKKNSHLAARELSAEKNALYYQSIILNE